MARRTGVESSHINKLRSYEKYGRKGLGADIIRLVRDGLKVDVAYFYDDYEGERDYRLYPLSAKRDEKRVSALEEADGRHDLAIAQLNARLAQLEAQNIALKVELASTTRKGRAKAG